MKKLILILSVAVILCISLFGFKLIKLGAISGKISPANNVASVSLISGIDTVKAPINQGSFKFSDLKEGVYSISLKALPPFKDTIINKVAVKDSATTDLGEIKLLQ
ncbi:carboxypeptidase regulatory-like domain-containing protein [Pedobacter mucosus]|uniref:carboxypeptidase regulatory-like domain-containing protein n=1 Tax=Pedobacter mucosus TaxID=2895286 RepID=UPI001EE47E79|nr:carboxypeptidase regulatory-like domain-containing protein [Pedobacter mucosus]UKT63663.1 carboxypeptidase regulatory-like domain-containing protein [Pedobacter mucosus]